MIEGGMLKDTYSGVVKEGFNPIRSAAQQVMGEKNGTTAYDAAALATSLGSLAYRVPLVVRLGDGMNRAKSINGVVVAQWQNGIFVPGASLFIFAHSNQAIQLGSNAYKAVTVAKDLNKEQK